MSSTVLIAEQGTTNALGEVTCSESVLIKMAEITAKKVEGVKSLGNITMRKEDESVSFSIPVTLEYGGILESTAKEIQNSVKKAVHTMTGATVKSIDINVRSLNLTDISA